MLDNVRKLKLKCIHFVLFISLKHISLKIFVRINSHMTVSAMNSNIKSNIYVKKRLLGKNTSRFIIWRLNITFLSR